MGKEHDHNEGSYLTSFVIGEMSVSRGTIGETGWEFHMPFL